MIHIPTEYTMPHSPGHERDVISAFLNNPMLREDYPHVTGEHFHLPETAAVWSIIEISPPGTIFDMTTFYEEANAKGIISRFGGVVGLSDLFARPWFAETLPKHIEKLNEYRARRLAITAALEIARSAFEDSDAKDLLEACSGPVTAIHDAAAACMPPLSTKIVVRDCMEAYKARLQGNQSPMGIPTIAEIDQYIRGLHGGRVIIIGAYSGGGKSVLGSQIIMVAALGGHPCLEINYEMRETDSMNRKIIQVSRVPSMAFMDPIRFAEENDCPPVNKGFLQSLARANDQLRDAPLRLVRPANRQLRTLLATIRKHVREMGAKIVMIDYLQLVRCKAGSPEQEVSEISHAIQEIAQELNISILLLSQINEKGDTKHGIVAIEDCDAYMVIEQERDKESEDFGRHYGILLAKDRHNGNSGKNIPLIFDSSLVRFVHGFVDKKRKPSAAGVKKKNV